MPGRTGKARVVIVRLQLDEQSGVQLVPDKVPGAGADFKVELGYAQVHAGVANQGKTVDPD